jgi:hypothetical protein
MNLYPFLRQLRISIAQSLEINRLRIPLRFSKIDLQSCASLVGEDHLVPLPHGASDFRRISDLRGRLPARRAAHHV